MVSTQENIFPVVPADPVPSVSIPGKNVFPAPTKIVVRKARRLKPTQQAFIRHYTTPGQPAFGNGTEAYHRSHPNCQSREAAAVGAYDTLRSPKVEEALEAWSRERLERELAWNVNQCKAKERYGDHREGVKVLAQLRGDWKERSEVESTTSEAKDALRRAVNEAISKQLRPITLVAEIVDPGAS